ncbi:MAG: DUF4397 domain-containing protein [Lacibacter sp.]|jgi:hypothetical protein
MKKLTNYALVGLVALGTLATTACRKENKEEARVLVVHASPDAPGVDLLVDNNRVNASALTFPNNTGYLTVAAGTRNIKVNAAGTSTTVINADVPFEKDRNYSLFAVNQLANIGALLVADDLTAPASGKAHIRFFHLSPGAPAVTVGVLSGGNFTPVFSNRAFESQESAAANQAFTPVDAGTYNFDVRVAGTGTSVLTLNNIRLEAGKIYTVFAHGIVGNTTTPLNAGLITHN